MDSNIRPNTVGSSISTQRLSLTPAVADQGRSVKRSGGRALPKIPAEMPEAQRSVYLRQVKVGKIKDFNDEVRNLQQKLAETKALIASLDSKLSQEYIDEYKKELDCLDSLVSTVSTNAKRASNLKVAAFFNYHNNLGHTKKFMDQAKSVNASLDRMIEALEADKVFVSDDQEKRAKLVENAKTILLGSAEERKGIEFLGAEILRVTEEIREKQGSKKYNAYASEILKLAGAFDDMIDETVGKEKTAFALDFYHVKAEAESLFSQLKDLEGSVAKGKRPLPAIPAYVHELLSKDSSKLSEDEKIKKVYALVPSITQRIFEAEKMLKVLEEKGSNLSDELKRKKLYLENLISSQKDTLKKSLVEAKGMKEELEA